MKRLVFLYNRADRVQIEMIYQFALEDSNKSGFEPWMDMPHVRHQGRATIGSDEDVDPQIERVISKADAILYFVGDMGLGAYQRDSETPAIEAAIRQRKGGDRPLHILPVLLSGGQASTLPNWAQGRFIINLDRTLRTPPDIWAAILMRLLAPGDDAEAQVNGPAEGARPADDLGEIVVQALRNELGRDSPTLTIFIGPYAYAAQGRESVGPAAMTEMLLSKISISADQLLPILPWPSEAAQWASLSEGTAGVRKLFTDALGKAGQDPPDLADSIGFLASRWLAWQGERTGRDPDWNGLLLLTTRVDLALESALSRIHQVHFTRILPTLNGADSKEVLVERDLRRMVQHWEPAPNWDPRPGVESPAKNVAKPKRNQLPNYSLDEAHRIILVKLCGSLDVQSSLILTAYDFFQKADDLKGLPRGLQAIIDTSPQLLLGRGFASPLAQLVRAYVLSRRQEHQKRFWVMPKLSPSECEADVLCQLELTLLAKDEPGFRDTLDANVLHRGEQNVFVRRLAELI